MIVEYAEIMKRFDLLYKTDQNVAKCQDGIFIESLELQGLTKEQIVLKIFKEINLLLQEAQACKRKDYLNFAGCKSRLFNVFFARFVLFDVSEEPELIKGIALNEKLKHIFLLFEDSKAKLNVFTFIDFLNEVMDIVFYDLNQKPTCTSRCEYFKMKNWQIKKKVECVNLQFEKIMERFIEFRDEVANRDTDIEKVKAEKQLLDELFKNATYSNVTQFMKVFLKIRGLLPDLLLDEKTEIHQMFCNAVKGKSNPYDFSPRQLRLAHEAIQAGRLSKSIVFYLALIKYRRWLTNVMEGKIGMMDPPDCNYEQLFELTYEKGLYRSKLLIVAFKLRWPSGKFTEEKYKSIILSELNILRLELNGLKNTDYYQLLLNKENTKNYFIDHCYLDNDIDIENQCCELRKAVVLSEMIKYFKSELINIDESYAKPSLDIDKLKNQFADIISSMVPNANINDQILRDYFKTVVKEQVRKPLFFIVEDLKDSIEGIFNKALINLQQILQTQPGNVMANFAVNQLNILRCKAINTRKDGLETEYFKVLKKTYKAHLHFVKDQRDYMIDRYESPLYKVDKPEPKPDSNKILAFNYNEIKDDKLALVLFALIKLKAIDKNTTLPQLRALVNGKEVTDPLRWLAGQGDLMAFIKEATSNGKLIFPHQQQWNIAIKCFIKADGSNFNSNVLKASRPTNMAYKFIKAANKF